MTWKKTLNTILKEHNKKSAKGGKAVSFGTQATRRMVLESGFAELRRLGYKLPDVKGFKERHMMALGKAWEERKLAAATVQNRISVFRLFAGWIGKRGMIRDAVFYVKDPASVARQLAAKVDKTWAGQNEKLADKLPRLHAQDPYVAMQLELQRAFGLRMKEAALLKPHQADKTSYLAVNWGSKGGRDRVIKIETDYQKDVMCRAKAMVKHRDRSMTPHKYSFYQWRSHYYYVCQENGISRQAGITSHGLRHERLNEIYTALTGHLSPVRGGVLNTASLSAVMRDQIARQEVSEIAGHCRPAIASAYLGSRLDPTTPEED